jgi:prophage antirepressor-like protein
MPRRLDEDERRDIDTIDVIGRTQAMAFVSEPGLYSLALRSRKKDVLAGRWHLTTK